MKHLLPRLKHYTRVLVGGPLGVVAWSLSGAGAMAVILWGIKAVAIPLLMIKTASWGIWGIGVLKESRTRRGTPRPNSAE